MSWLHTGAGYHLLCNRDERRARRPADPPRIEQCGATRLIAPRDGDAGGSWIAVNEWGVAVCLLNGGAHASRPAPLQSRGTLLMHIAPAANTREVCKRASELDLAPFAAFTLVTIAPGEAATVLAWDGLQMTATAHGERLMPLTSSSFDDDGARTHRRKEFDRLTGAGRRVTPETLYAFHESHGCHADAYSTCMHRADAATVSFSWITVTRDTADFFYAPGAPCELRGGESIRLLRKSGGLKPAAG